MTFGFVSWIVIILPLTLLYSYTISIDFRRKKLIKIINMKENEVIDYLKHKNYRYYRFLREMSYDGQIVTKVREAANELL
jgi:hypothetical protein